MTGVFKRPLVTEKTLGLAGRGWYTFMVDPDADKNEIAKAIGAFYNVQVVDVRTVSMHGKTRRTGKYMRYVKKSDWKKAMVRLVKGQKIDVFEVTPNEEKEPAKSEKK